MTDLRLLPATAAAWGAALLLAPEPNWGIAAGLWAATSVVVVLALRWRRLAVLALLLVAAALIATVCAARPHAGLPERVDAVATTSETARGSPFEASIDGVPVLVFADGELPDLPLGARFKVAGATEPGGDRIRALVFADELELLEDPPAILAAGGAARAALLEATSGLPGGGGQLLPGLAVGDTSRVSASLDRAMTVSSLTHLTAVSGANCAIVVGLVMLAARRLPLMARVVLAVIALAGFVVLVTPQPSVVRAAVMALIVLVALARGRPARGVPVLCAATIGLLVLDPWFAHEYGFALSVLATGGLLVLAPPIAARLQRWLPTWLALAIAIPVAAQAACQPVLILLDPSLPTYGVLANLLAEPAAPIATVLGLVVCGLAVVAPQIAAVVAPLAWLPAAWIAGVAEFCAGLPLPSLPWPAAPLGVLLLLGIGALFAFAPRVAALALVLAIAAGLGVRVGVLIDRPADWQFAMCDVGQGDATLARSDGLVMLVDTGPDPAALADCLGELGIGRIDLLVLTHYDLDHVGGTEAVIGKVDHVVVGPSSGPDDDRVVAELVMGGATVSDARPGESAVFGQWRSRVLWPDGGVEPGNAASVTIALEPLTASAISAILLGDLGEEPQDAMARLSRPLPVEVVKVAHHGSGDQSAALYDQLDAAVGLIGVGADNDYGHPTDRLLGILAGAGTTALRTDTQGMLLVSRGDDGGLEVWTERPG